MLTKQLKRIFEANDKNILNMSGEIISMLVVVQKLLQSRLLSRN